MTGELGGRVVGLEVDEGGAQATSIRRADHDVDVVVSRHQVVMSERAEQQQRAAIQHLDDAEPVADGRQASLQGRQHRRLFVGRHLTSEASR